MAGEKVTEGMRIEVRGSLTAEGEEPTYGPWLEATVARQDRVSEPDVWFIVFTGHDRMLIRRYADEGKTWQRIPEVRRG